MCHQFKLPTLQEISQYLNHDLDLPLSRPKFAKPENEQEKDIFPGQIAPVLLYQDGKLQLQEKSWGYPSPIDENKPLFNARIERFYEQKPSMWDQSFAKQRCIIITSEFYEYSKKVYQADNHKKYHEKFSFLDPKHPLTLIAGIYDQNHFAMVTTEPNKDMKPIHNRMPLVIQPEELRHWLFQNFTDLIDRQNFKLAVTKLNHKN